MKRNVNRRLLGLMIAGVLLVAANALGWLQPIKSGLNSVVAPVGLAFGRGGSDIANFFNVLSSAGDLAAENKKLAQENATLRQRVAADTELRAQNESFRQQFNFGAIRPDKLVAAEVVGYQPDNFRQFIFINRGSREGIKNGMAVVAEGSLIGTISEVTATGAKVFLVVDPNSRVAALNQDQISRPTGVVRGLIGGGLLMEKIPQNEVIKQGDTIVTSGLGGGLPKGIIVGRVETVDNTDNGVFQSARLSTNVRFNRLDLVYVVVRGD
jgi:rod shape-determining protein MreC